MPSPEEPDRRPGLLGLRHHVGGKRRLLEEADLKAPIPRLHQAGDMARARRRTSRLPRSVRHQNHPWIDGLADRSQRQIVHQERRKRPPEHQRPASRWFWRRRHGLSLRSKKPSENRSGRHKTGRPPHAARARSTTPSTLTRTEPTSASGAGAPTASAIPASRALFRSPATFAMRRQQDNGAVCHLATGSGKMVGVAGFEPTTLCSQSRCTS